MSYVADVVLLAGIRDSGVAEIQGWLKANDWPQLVEISDHAGGNKAMQCEVWAAAINYFDIEGFSKMVHAAQWESPESVQLLIKDEEDDSFVLRVGELRYGGIGGDL